MWLDDAALTLLTTQAPRLLYQVVGPFVTVHDVCSANSISKERFGARMEYGADGAWP